MSSNAVGQARKSAVVGYLIAKGSFQEVSPNLPQRIAVLCEANSANQAAVLANPTYTPTSAQQVGALFGYGSPAYAIARILLPNNTEGVGGIPVVFYPQSEPGSATAKTVTIQPVGTATGNATHTIVVAGRTNVDSQSYDINIVTGDTVSSINTKITNALNAVLGCPANVTTDTYTTNCTTKWKGLTANEFNITVDTKGTAIGLTYTITTTQVGVGTPSVAAALLLYAQNWNTITLNGYGLVSATMGELETFNGRPDNTSPTGRFQGTVMRPTIAFSGSVLDDPSSITDARLNDCTICVSPAPGSAGFSFEAAANHVFLAATVAQNTPELDVLNLTYPDMPTPTSIGSMADYNNRDAFVKKGCSTVSLANGLYRLKDSVTTYHPTGEIPPQFAYTRDLLVDWNVRYGYYLLEQLYVIGKVIADDNDATSSQNVVKPKSWKQVLTGYFADLVSRALIVDDAFSDSSLVVNISTSNPNRFETTFNIKRSGVARISATTAVMGFNFGTLNS